MQSTNGFTEKPSWDNVDYKETALWAGAGAVAGMTVGGFAMGATPLIAGGKITGTALGMGTLVNSGLSTGINALAQTFIGGNKWGDFDTNSLVSSYVTGGLSGATGVGNIGRVGQAAINAGLAGGSTWLNGGSRVK